MQQETERNKFGRRMECTSETRYERRTRRVSQFPPAIRCRCGRRMGALAMVARANRNRCQSPPRLIRNEKNCENFRNNQREILASGT
ncbi:jg15005 [Pararge aegeria aegeria]|uniref:Jg15005 protein n=1 Tax=Pararge aegeria aegeria TaxID=348720 RepID=A0A8S4QFQ5_9NEOP|nr:jg15005 [Pararge aegeria aegeria]